METRPAGKRAAVEEPGASSSDRSRELKKYFFFLCLERNVLGLLDLTIFCLVILT